MLARQKTLLLFFFWKTQKQIDKSFRRDRRAQKMSQQGHIVAKTWTYLNIISKDSVDLAISIKTNASEELHYSGVYENQIGSKSRVDHWSLLALRKFCATDRPIKPIGKELAQKRETGCYVKLYNKTYGEGALLVTSLKSDLGSIDTWKKWLHQRYAITRQ